MVELYSRCKRKTSAVSLSTFQRLQEKSINLQLEHFVLGMFSRWNLFELGTFCSLGCFVAQDVLEQGTFWSKGRFVAWDVLQLGMFFRSGRLVCVTYCIWGVMSPGVLYLECYVSGRFVFVPKQLHDPSFFNTIYICNITTPAILLKTGSGNYRPASVSTLAVL